MKTIALAAAITLGATSAFAGSMDTMAMDAAPMVEAAPMEEASTGTSPLVWIIPLLAIAAVVATQD